MLVKIDYNDKLNKLSLNFTFENTDTHSFYTLDKKLVTSFKTSCYFQLPDNFDYQELHPDRLALAILLCCYPFIGKRLELPFNVSTQFATTLYQQTNIQFKSDNQITPLNFDQIIKNEDTVPSLCLSMGFDSMAGLLIMPNKTTGVFLDRIIGLSDTDSYKKDAAYHGLNMVSQLRKKYDNKIYVVGTDMEYLRKSIGFMIDISVGVPAILLSNHCNFYNISYGYSIHHYEHIHQGSLIGFCTGDDTQFKYHSWNKIFQSAGLYLNMVTMGLSEIGTLKIVMNSPFKNISTGCMRGNINRPCLNCKKCYRKILLKYYLQTGNIKANPKVYQKLSQYPYHTIANILDLDTLQFSYGFMTANYQGKDPFLLSVKNGLSKYKNKFKYLDKWFNGANVCIDYRTYQSIIKNLEKYNISLIS